MLHFTEQERKAMAENRILCDLDIDPADDSATALGVLLDNSTWDDEPKRKAALTSAIRKLAAHVSQYYKA